MQPARRPGAVRVAVHAGHDPRRRTARRCPNRSGNVISPQPISSTGSEIDAARVLRAVRSGPLPTRTPPWSDTSRLAAFTHRFLSRLWQPGGRAQRRRRQRESPDAADRNRPNPQGDALDAGAQGQLGDRQSHDVTSATAGRLSFNTAIAAVIELVNDLYLLQLNARPRPRAGSRPRRRLRCCSLFAPHLGAEVYERLTGERVWEQPWPDRRSRRCCVADTFELVCQVNGKVRDRVTAPYRRHRARSSSGLCARLRWRQGSTRERSSDRQEGDRRARTSWSTSSLA